jgi:lipoprotein-anchoring transpeptidase ErfK/SrfK
MDEVLPQQGRVALVMKAPGRRFRVVVASSAAAVLTLALLAARGTGYTYGPAPRRAVLTPADLPSDAAATRKLQTKLLAQSRQLATALDKLSPAGTYVVVDQMQNRLYIMNDDKIVRTAVCSAGSGMVLRASGSSKKWVFDTPRGVFKVRNKISNPIWKKPDWAFAEEGKTLPTNPADRFESGTLGKYALYLEDGYMIHGTLYTRLLGRSVTHGCIRLGPEDLQAVWDAVPVGSSVYIF